MACRNQGSDAMSDGFVPRRESRRLRGLGPRHVAQGPPLEKSMPYLPPEILSLVAGYLDKANCKTLRFVSKQWNAVATPLLFDHVYVSSHGKDLEIFKNICRHPQLRTSIKKVVYDVSIFISRSEDDYFNFVCRLIRQSFHYWRRSLPYFSKSPRLRQLASAIDRNTPYSTLYPKFKTLPFIKKGFAEWRHNVEDQRECFHGGFYLSDLRSGFSELSNLQSIYVDGRMWTEARIHTGRYIRENGSRFPSLIFSGGSPLARSWNILRPGPKTPTQSDYINNTSHFNVVTQALSQARRKIKEFGLRFNSVEGLPQSVFAKDRPLLDLSRQLSSNFEQLEILNLQITPRASQILEIYEDPGNLGFLPNLLGYMMGLKRLSLNFEIAEAVVGTLQNSYRVSEDCYTYSDVFLPEERWPNLAMLHLRGLAISGIDLYFLIYCQTPNLNQLSLSHIDLIEGRWEGIMESIRCTKREWELLSFRGWFRHSGGRWWPDHPCRTQINRDALREYSEYVRFGGRRPCLSPDRPDSDSRHHDFEFLRGTSFEDWRAVKQQLRISLQYWEG